MKANINRTLGPSQQDDIYSTKGGTAKISLVSILFLPYLVFISTMTPNIYIYIFWQEQVLMLLSQDMAKTEMTQEAVAVPSFRQPMKHENY